MKRLVFVRHGSTDSNAGGKMRGLSEDPLSALGRQQALRTAEYLVTQAPFDHIYTSTLPRSLETGQLLCEKLGLGCDAREGLREINLGSMEGGAEEELWSYFANQAKIGSGSGGMTDVVFPDGEAVSQFLSRVTREIKEVVNQRHEAALVVCHGVWTMVALGMWFEPDIREWPKFRLDNCSISEVILEPGPRLVRLNETAHLNPTK